MSTIASQITSLTIVYSPVYSGADQSEHQSSASLALVWGIHRGPVNSPHKWPVTRKMFPFEDVIMPLIVSIAGIARDGRRATAFGDGVACKTCVFENLSNPFFLCQTTAHTALDFEYDLHIETTSISISACDLISTISQYSVL